MSVLKGHRVLFVALFLAAITILPLSTVELGRDQANWLTVAMALQNGSVMYHDVAVVNTPGLGVLFAAVNMITDAPRLTPWIVHLVAVIATITAGYVWVARSFGQKQAAGAALLTAVLWTQTMDWWEIAQKDGVAFAFALCAMALLAARPQRRSASIGAGILVAAAALTKTPAILYAAPLIAQTYVTSPNARVFTRDLLWGILGCLSVFGLAMIYLTWNSAWPAAWASLVERAAAYGGFKRLSPDMGAVRLLKYVFQDLYVVLLAPLLCVLPWSSWSVRLVPFAVLILATALVFVLQGRGFYYHAVPVSASVALAVGACLGTILSRDIGWTKTIAVLLVGVSLVMSWADRQGRWLHYVERLTIGMAAADTDALFPVRDMAKPSESRKVANWIRQNTAPADRIIVWGMESQVYIYSRRMFVGPSFADAPIWHPQLAAKSPDYFNTQRARFYTDLKSTPPEVFVVARNDANPVEPWPSDRSLRSLPEIVAFLNGNYTLAIVTDHFLVYRRDPTP